MSTNNQNQQIASLTVIFNFQRMTQLNLRKVRTIQKQFIK